MKRRACVAVLGAAGLLQLVVPLASLAQSKDRVPLVGLLISETLSGQATRIETLRAGLRERGYSVEARTISFEIRAAEGNYERLPGMAAELVGLKVDVLVAFGSKAAVAASRATQAIPIVVPLTGDPVALGLAKSLAQSGTNVTGNAVLNPQTAAKQVELLKEAVPRIRRIAHFWNPANAQSAPIKAMRATADRLKVELRQYEARGPKDFARGIAEMAKAGMEAVVFSGDTLFRTNAREIAKLAIKHRLLSSGPREYADAGCLIGYGAIELAMYRRSAYFIDRILKGAKPTDLPIEQPTRFELVINLNTAKALGIKIPQSILVRADRVIE